MLVCVIPRPQALKPSTEEDLMLTSKKIVKATAMLTAALMISVTVPTEVIHAASLQEKVGSTSSWVNRIFDQVWKRVQGGSPDKDKTENSDERENKNPNENGSDHKDTPANDRDDSSHLTLADQIIQTGEKYLGTPYQYGAKAGQTRTFDCSSFTQYVYKQHGISLPRNSRQQSTVGQTVPRSEIKRGDLLFFTTSKSNGRIGHVAIYAGNNKVLHTWGPGGVRYDTLTGWLDRNYVHAKRVIQLKS